MTPQAQEKSPKKNPPPQEKLPPAPACNEEIHPYRSRINELLAHLALGPATLPACPSRDALEISQTIFPVPGGKWDLRSRATAPLAPAPRPLAPAPRPLSAPPLPSPPSSAKSSNPRLKATATAEDAVAALRALGATSEAGAVDTLKVGAALRVDARRAGAALNRAYGRGLVDRELRLSARHGLRGREVMVWWATREAEKSTRPPTVKGRLEAAESARQVALDALRKLGATSRRTGVSTADVGRAAARPLAYPANALYAALERGEVGRAQATEVRLGGHCRQMVRWWITEGK